MNLCGEQLHEYLKGKLLSSSDVQFHLIEWVLKRDYCHMQPDQYKREVTTLWQKYKSPHKQFSYLCAVGVALKPCYLVVQKSHKFYMPLRAMGITEQMFGVLLDLVALGDVVAEYPKFACLDLKLEEFSRIKLSVRNFFGDRKYVELHKFWQTVERQTIDDDAPEAMDDAEESIEIKDALEILTEMWSELKEELQPSVTVKETSKNELKVKLKNEIKELIYGKLTGELNQS